MSDSCPTSTAELVPWLHLRWNRLLEAESARIGTGAEILHTICTKYTEPHRFYHNLGHIKALLDLADEFRPQLTQPALVEWAIWFHDVIYDTKRQDNEPQSAEFARHALNRLGIGPETAESVGLLILATRTHSAEHLSSDGRFFLDFDLSILGAAPAVYETYSKAIRAEYAWVWDFFYRRTRKKVLRQFLERPELYFTTDLRDRLETQARINLQEEINQLED
ncbi:MAG: hypothetical protein K1Y36_24285 [Blastocatellia bacterium]|nr:hypothetical protein [Blastocatellia bacterium]